MAVLTRTITRTTRIGGLAFAACALTTTSLVSGAGLASADPNNPSMTEVSPDGQLQSGLADRFAGGELCVANMGTLPTSVVRTFEQGVPNQIIEETGPEWVGSRGWQAVGINPADPWGGAFDPRNARTGPACSPVSADGF